MEKLIESCGSNVVQSDTGKLTSEVSSKETRKTRAASWRVIKRKEKSKSGSKTNSTGSKSNAVEPTTESTVKTSQTGSTVSRVTKETKQSSVSYNSNMIQHAAMSSNCASQGSSTRSTARSPAIVTERAQEPLPLLHESSNYSLYKEAEWQDLHRALASPGQTTRSIDLYENLDAEWEDLEREIHEARPLFWSSKDDA